MDIQRTPFALSVFFFLEEIGDTVAAGAATGKGEVLFTIYC